MNEITSKTNRSRLLHFRCSFFSVDYRDEEMTVNVKSNENEMNVKKDITNEMKKIVNVINRKNMKNEMKININCKCNKTIVKIDKMKIGIEIVKEIIWIGTALMGLLPSQRQRLVREVIA